MGPNHLTLHFLFIFMKAHSLSEFAFYLYPFYIRFLGLAEVPDTFV